MADTQAHPELFDRYRSDVEAVLRASAERAPRTLAGMLSTQMGWQDEKGQPAAARAHGVESGPPLRLHATLCLLACEALAGSHSPALLPAAAMELLHNAFLVHDDIQEGSPDQSGRPTLWWLWGPAQAINAGDALYALARLAVLRLDEGGPSAGSPKESGVLRAGHGLPPERALHVARLFDEACLRRCEGQSLDIEARARAEAGVARSLDVLERRAGALMGCAAETGAAVAGGDERACGAFRSFGQRLAVAQQVREDIASLWGGPDVPAGQVSDSWTRRKGLPVLYALEKAPVPEQRQLRALYGKRALDATDAARLRALLEQAGARAYAEEVVRRLRDEALEAVRGIPLGEKALADCSALARFLAQPGL